MITYPEISIYDILKSNVSDNGTVTAQLGDATTSSVLYDHVQYWQPFGLTSLPPAITSSNITDAPQALVLDMADQNIIFAGRYISNQTKYGNAEAGDTLLYSGGEARILLKNKNNSIQIYTRNGEGGVGIGINVFPADDIISFTNSKGYGIRITPNGVEILAGSSVIEVKPDLIQSLSGGVNQVDGTGVLLGSQGIPGINSAVHGPVGLSGVGSTKVTIEP